MSIAFIIYDFCDPFAEEVDEFRVALFWLVQNALAFQIVAEEAVAQHPELPHGYILSPRLKHAAYKPVDVIFERIGAADAEDRHGVLCEGFGLCVESWTQILAGENV